MNRLLSRRTSFPRLSGLSAYRTTQISQYNIPRTSYGLLGRTFATIMAPNSTMSESEVRDRILHVLKNWKSIDPSITVSPNAHFVNDLGMDSLETVELMMALEDEFCIEIPEDDMAKLVSIPATTQYIVGHPNAK